MVNPVAGRHPASQPLTAQQPDRLKEASEQFEAFFVEMLLKQMRSANAALRGEKASLSRSTYEGWQDEQTARSIAGAGGLGLGKMLYQQLQQQGTSGKR